MKYENQQTGVVAERWFAGGRNETTEEERLFEETRSSVARYCG
jgi:hypothetical protein